MKGTVSFHPIRVEFFDEIVQPLVAGRKVNPEAFLEATLIHRAASFRARRYPWTLEEILTPKELPPVERGAGLLENIRTQLKRLDNREDELTVLVRKHIDPELHLHGRPFLITEGSPGKVAERVDEYLDARDGDAVDSICIEQLIQADKELVKQVGPADIPELSADLSYRSDMLSGLRALYDLANSARAGESWGPAGGRRRPAKDVLREELPFMAVALHARAQPFWIARDVDGLETICRAADVSPPDYLVPPRRLFAEVCAEFPDLGESLGVELKGTRDAAAFVGPDDIPDLVEFLNTNGSRIIQAAARHDEGPMCRTLLRKIRECAAYAHRNGSGYIEASGVLPPDIEEGTDPDEGVPGLPG